MTHVTIPGSGRRLWTRVDGGEGRPWIVLANSLGSDHSMWDPQIEMLTRRYRVLRFDTRGHGKSDTPPGDWTLADLEADTLALMDAHGIDKADYMGLSLGGMVGLGLALRAPQRFGRMVMADGRADAPEAFLANWDNRIGKVRAEGLQGIVDMTLETWFTPDWIEANPETVKSVRAMVLGNDPEGYILCCGALKGLDYLRRLGEIAVPILYVVGEADKGAAPEVMREMANATPGSWFEVVAGAAHIANMNNPEGFNRAIGAHLGLTGG
jgi:3-oxoadipate enol-lactonase